MIATTNYIFLLSIYLFTTNDRWERKVVHSTDSTRHCAHFSNEQFIPKSLPNVLLRNCFEGVRYFDYLFYLDLHPHGISSELGWLFTIIKFFLFSSALSSKQHNSQFAYEVAWSTWQYFHLHFVTKLWYSVGCKRNSLNLTFKCYESVRAWPLFHTKFRSNKVERRITPMRTRG